MKTALLSISVFSLLLFINSCSSDPAGALCNGSILIPFQEDIDKKWGYIDSEGNIIIEPEFKERPSPAINGIALIEDERKGERIYRYIKIEGDKAIESDDSWKEAGMFREGLAPVRNDNEKVSFIKEDYSTAFTVDAERVGYFNNGLAAIQNIENKWGFINNEGKEAIAPKYDRIIMPFNADGYAIVLEITGDEEKTSEYKVIDKSGEVKLDLKDKYAEVLGMNEGLILVEKDGYGFIDLEGEKVIKTNEDWDRVTLFRNGYASFKEEGEWGLMDMEGNEIIKPKYKEPLIFENNKAWALNDDGEWGLIDLEDNDLIDFQYETKRSPLPFYCSSTIIEDGENSWVFIDEKGEEINKFEYENVSIRDIEFIVQDYPWPGTFESDYFDPSVATNLFDYNKLSVIKNGKDYVDFMLGQGLTKDELMTDGNYRNINLNYEYDWEDGSYSYKMSINGYRVGFNFADRLKEFKYPKGISSITFEGRFSENYAVSKEYSQNSGLFKSINETYPEYYDDESEKKAWLSKALKNIDGNAKAELNSGTIMIYLNGRGEGNGNLVAKDIARLIKMEDSQEFDKNDIYVKQGKIGERYVVVYGQGSSVNIVNNISDDIFQDFDALNGAEDQSYYDNGVETYEEEYYDDYYGYEEATEAATEAAYDSLDWGW